MAGVVREKTSTRLCQTRYLLVRRQTRDPGLVEVEQLSADEPVLPASHVSMLERDKL